MSNEVATWLGNKNCVTLIISYEKWPHFMVVYPYMGWLSNHPTDRTRGSNTGTSFQTIYNELRVWSKVMSRINIGEPGDSSNIGGQVWEPSKYQSCISLPAYNAAHRWLNKYMNPATKSKSFIISYHSTKSSALQCFCITLWSRDNSKPHKLLIWIVKPDLR